MSRHQTAAAGEMMGRTIEAVDAANTILSPAELRQPGHLHFTLDDGAIFSVWVAEHGQLAMRLSEPDDFEGCPCGCDLKIGDEAYARSHGAAA